MSQRTGSTVDQGVQGSGHGTKRRPDLDSLYCINADGSRNKIHTADVRGRYQRRKKILWSVLIALYVGLPWIEIKGHPAVLLDIPRRHFYLLGNTFNAQDFWLAFFVISGVGFALLVVSALWGRVWCGYACPQTVFLEGVFRRVERFFEGNAAKRTQLDARGISLQKVLRRVGKYTAYLALSVVLSHTFLGYFMPVRDVVHAVVSPPSAHPTAFAFVVGFTAIIYLNFAWFREQLCIVICPYGRLQGVLFDKDTVNVGYDKERGEPRGKHSAWPAATANEADVGAGRPDGAADAVVSGSLLLPLPSTESSRHAKDRGKRSSVPGRGHCIDCFRCVAVCPTGIDIRDGTQLECVGCANCIDACDEVMDKVGQPRGLVRYDSQRGFEQQQRRFWRGRVALYAVLFAIGVVVFVLAASRRTAFEANLVRVPGSAYTLDGDMVTNAFTVHLVNKTPEPLTFTIDPVPDNRLQWTIPVRSLTLASLADQRLPIVARFARGAVHGDAESELMVSCASGQRRVKVRLLAP